MIKIDCLTERLSEEKKGLVRIVTASWGDRKRGKKVYLKAGKIDLAKEHVDGSFEIRGAAEYHSMSGYGVSSSIAWKDHQWAKQDRRWYKDNPNDYNTKDKGFRWAGLRGGWDRPSIWAITGEEERNLILKHYPGFKWLMEKIEKKYSAGVTKGAPISLVWRMLQQWLRMPEAELLWQENYFTLAESRALTRRTDKEKKRILAWLRKTPMSLIEKQTLTMGKADACSRGMPSEDYDLMKYHKMKKEDLEYYRQQKKRGVVDHPYEFRVLYDDYKRMLDRSEHNKEDEYWKRPKDLREAHNKLMAEEEKKEEAQKAEELKKLKRVTRRWAGKEVVKGDLRVYVPRERSEIVKQAKCLHQCLVSAGYDTMMANGEVTLVFISRKGEPAATAEIFNNARLGQFFGDEKAGWGESEPKEDEKAALEAWRKQYFNKPKRTRRKAA